MTAKKVFTVAQPALHNIVKAVYTNRKDLFTALTEVDDVKIIEFKDVLGYDNKKFNYINVLTLLKVLHNDDSFTVKITKNNGMIHMLEISVKTTNSKLAL